MSSKKHRGRAAAGDGFDLDKFQGGKASNSFTDMDYNMRYNPAWARLEAIPFLLAGAAALAFSHFAEAPKGMNKTVFYVVAGLLFATGIFLFFFGPSWRKANIASRVQYCRRVYGSKASDERIRVCMEDRASFDHGSSGSNFLGMVADWGVFFLIFGR
jgi:hypothetical protein